MQHPNTQRLDQDLQTWLDIHPEIQLTPQQRQIALLIWVGAKVFYRPIEPAGYPSGDEWVSTEPGDAA